MFMPRTILMSLLLFSGIIHGRSYEEAMTNLALDLSERLTAASTGNVLVSPFKRVDGRMCELSSTLTLDLEAALASHPKTYRLLDRQNLEALAAEHMMEMSGQMDEEQRMREAGKLLKADVIIFGYFTHTSDLLVLRVKAVDIQTAEQIAVLSATCAPSAIIKGLCPEERQENAKPPETVGAGGGTTTHDTPAVDVNAPDCASKRTGSYCFTNKGKIDLQVIATLPAPGPTGFTREKYLLVRPGKRECFVDQAAGSHPYTLTETAPYDATRSDNHRKVVGRGTLVFRTCTTEHMIYP